MRLQIDEELRNVGQMENGQKSAEWEAQVFNRSRTREEYVKLVATLVRKLRDYKLTSKILKKVHKNSRSCYRSNKLISRLGAPTLFFVPRKI